MEYDVIIVGAGLLGLATAYHIKELRPEDQVLVLDRLNGPGQGNTAKSAAMMRSFFYSKTNFLLADTSIEFYKHVQEDLGYDLRIRWTGYLWLFNEADYRAIKPILRELSGRGLEYRVLEAEHLEKTLNLRARVSEDEEAKLMGLKDVDYGVLVPKAGCIDVDSLVKFYEEGAKSRGVKFRYGVEVNELLVEPKKPLGLPGEPFFWQEARIAGVRTSEGVFRAKKTILAAGAWTPLLLDQVGIECFIKARKRQIFSIRADTEALRKLFHAPGYNEEGILPFVILPGPRVWLKAVPEENAFWTCFSDDFPRAFKVEDEPSPEMEFYEYGIYQVLTKYFPQFKSTRPYTAWAGLYAYCTLDGQPVVFEEHDVLVVSGASGSGVMKADALGRIAAALYAGEEYAELYGGEKFRVSDLGLRERRVEPEKLII